jgi:membrane-associated phospholipid phosphatase
VSLASSAAALADEEPKLFFSLRAELYQEQGIPTPVPEAAKASRPNLVRQIGSDFKSVFTTKENLLVLGLGAGAAWTASPLDEEIAFSRFNSEIHEGGALDEVFEAGTPLGGAAVQVGGAFATWGLGKLFSRPDVEELGRDLVRAQIVTLSLTQAVKVVAGRTRPDGSDNQSFPSGHASGSFATATVLQRHYGWKVGIPAYAVAGYIAASRLSNARHYLSDVVFGASVGILVGRTITMDVGKNRVAVVPLLVPSGGGVEFIWLGSARSRN